MRHVMRSFVMSIWYARRESNPRFQLRRLTSYPLDYERVCNIHYYSVIAWACQISGISVRQKQLTLSAGSAQIVRETVDAVDGVLIFVETFDEVFSLL